MFSIICIANPGRLELASCVRLKSGFEGFLIHTTLSEKGSLACFPFRLPFSSHRDQKGSRDRAERMQQEGHVSEDQPCLLFAELVRKSCARICWARSTRGVPRELERELQAKLGTTFSGREGDQKHCKVGSCVPGSFFCPALLEERRRRAPCFDKTVHPPRAFRFSVYHPHAQTLFDSVSDP